MAHIVIAEDNAEVSAYLRRQLKKSGHTVRMVNNALDAWRAVGTEPFDALLINTALPGVDGLTVAQKAVENNPEAQVVFLAGFSGVAMETRRGGARPFHLGEISRKLEALMHGGYFADAADAPGTVIYPDFAARRTAQNR